MKKSATLRTKTQMPSKGKSEAVIAAEKALAKAQNRVKEATADLKRAIAESKKTPPPSQE